MSPVPTPLKMPTLRRFLYVPGPVHFIVSGCITVCLLCKMSQSQCAFGCAEVPQGRTLISFASRFRIPSKDVQTNNASNRMRLLFDKPGEIRIHDLLIPIDIKRQFDNAHCVLFLCFVESFSFRFIDSISVNLYGFLLCYVTLFK